MDKSTKRNLIRPKSHITKTKTTANKLRMKTFIKPLSEVIDQKKEPFNCVCEKVSGN